MKIVRTIFMNYLFIMTHIISYNANSMKKFKFQWEMRCVQNGRIVGIFQNKNLIDANVVKKEKYPLKTAVESIRNKTISFWISKLKWKWYFSIPDAIERVCVYVFQNIHKQTLTVNFIVKFFLHSLSGVDKKE